MTIVSGGSFCLPAILLKKEGIRNEAMPFDWLFCNVNSLIKILQSDFKYFLDTAAITSLTEEKGHPCATNSHYDGGRKNRPLFNHKDPTRNEDREYYIKCINRFMNLKSSPNTLFVFEEFGEIYSLYDNITSTLEKHMPGMKIYAVRHRKTSNTSSIEIVKNDNGHILIDFFASNVVGGISFERGEDSTLLMKHLMSVYK